MKFFKGQRVVSADTDGTAVYGVIEQLLDDFAVVRITGETVGRQYEDWEYINMEPAVKFRGGGDGRT